MGISLLSSVNSFMSWIVSGVCKDSSKNLNPTREQSSFRTKFSFLWIKQVSTGNTVVYVHMYIFLTVNLTSFYCETQSV